MYVASLLIFAASGLLSGDNRRARWETEARGLVR
jgi:hypothetical protein